MRLSEEKCINSIIIMVFDELKTKMKELGINRSGGDKKIQRKHTDEKEGNGK